MTRLWPLWPKPQEDPEELEPIRKRLDLIEAEQAQIRKQLMLPNGKHHKEKTHAANRTRQLEPTG